MELSSAAFLVGTGGGAMEVIATLFTGCLSEGSAALFMGGQAGATVGADGLISMADWAAGGINDAGGAADPFAFTTLLPVFALALALAGWSVGGTRRPKDWKTLVLLSIIHQAHAQHRQQCHAAPSVPVLERKLRAQTLKQQEQAELAKKPRHCPIAKVPQLELQWSLQIAHTTCPAGGN